MDESEKMARRAVGTAPRAVKLIDDLRQAREQVAATSEILAILADSSTAAEEVFDAIVERARTLCRADAAQIHLVQGGRLRAGPIGGPERGVPRLRRHTSCSLGTEHHWSAGSAWTRPPNRSPMSSPTPSTGRPDLQRRAGYRTILGAPMLVDDEVMGVLTVWRTIVAPFDERVASC